MGRVIFHIDMNSFFASCEIAENPELKGQKVKLTLLCPGSVPTRDDIIEDIKAQGLTGKLSQKSPNYIVKKGLKALEKNKTVCVPGAYNRLVRFISSITPV